METTNKIIVLPGDGIGPEVTDEAIAILKTVCKQHNHDINIENYPIGGAGIDRNGRPLTDETLGACKQSSAVLLGAVGGPKWNDQPKDKRPESALLQLRKELDLFANLRPVRTYNSLLDNSPLKNEVVDGVNIMFVRELTGGIYFGQPRFIKQTENGTHAVDTLSYTDNEIQRVAQTAFETAGKRNKSVYSVDKANVLDSSRLWRKTVEKSADQWPNITLNHMLVDNFAMQLIRDPKQFDVVLTGNMFGDILSDEASMLTGSIGMLPSASLGKDYAMYEPIHGSAPDIAGQGIANPIAAIASVALMCRHSLGMPKAATEIEEAIESTLAQGLRTSDVYNPKSDNQKVSTSEMGGAICRKLDS